MKRTRFHDNRAGGKWAIRWALFALLLALLACNLPLTAPPGDLPTPAPITWLTNTPGPDEGVLESPAPSGDVVALPSPTLPPTATPPPDAVIIDNTPYLYNAQAGDSIYPLAVRFSVLPAEITSPDPFSEIGLIRPGQLLIIPRRLANTTSATRLVPDSDLVHSPSAALFDTHGFVAASGGYLATYRQYLGTGWTDGAEIVDRVALANSISPRVLLALLQYRAGWVYGQPVNDTQEKYPMGLIDPNRDGLYAQLNWAVGHLSVGYYGWREGLLTDVIFTDGALARLAPDLNAGSVAIMYFFAQVLSSTDWLAATHPDTGFAALHAGMFGNPWDRAAVFEPMFPNTLDQPEMILPFEMGSTWSFSGGPHGAWGRTGAMAAIDFAPSATEPGCVPSDEWVTAAAPGVVVRTAEGVLVLDLDGDGNESTGWVLVYLHLASENKLETGTWVSTGQFLGRPSCEGGFSTGTHIHIARKYNGEWMLAGGSIPFNLSGWVVGAGSAPYEGTLTRGDVVIKANQLGTASTLVTRDN
ncbi:MAG TPA: M23 family metallopeptidase [Anaerolineales bacterium]|nr:M23 family metallopeptidase [Anaerolineales bacterium]